MRPVIITIPHASNKVPEELKDRVLLSEHDLLSFTDIFTERIYAIPDTYVVHSKTSLVVLDVNRAPDDIAKEYEGGKDGVMIHQTWDGRKIYKEEPSEAEVTQLIHKYHDPFHEEVDSYIPNARFLIDGHSYKPVGPVGKPDAGENRPDINLGNVNYTTCTREHTIFFREFFERHGYSVSINFPYKGRYTLGRHCHRRRIPHFLVPGIQIELNQNLYMKDLEKFIPDESAITQLNQLMQKVVDEFMKRCGFE